MSDFEREFEKRMRSLNGANKEQGWLREQRELPAKLVDQQRSDFIRKYSPSVCDILGKIAELHCAKSGVSYHTGVHRAHFEDVFYRDNPPLPENSMVYKWYELYYDSRKFIEKKGFTERSEFVRERDGALFSVRFHQINPIGSKEFHFMDEAARVNLIGHEIILPDQKLLVAYYFSIGLRNIREGRGPFEQKVDFGRFLIPEGPNALEGIGSSLLWLFDHEDELMGQVREENARIHRLQYPELYRPPIPYSESSHGYQG